jgi:rhombotail lipoprotein
VAGEKNDTQTMLDTAVYDIESKKMLLRAPGTSMIKGSSTIVNLSEELRKDSLEGIEEATTQMISNLGAQLEKLKEKIKRKPETVKIVKSVNTTGATGGGDSGGGGGAVTGLEILTMLSFLLLAQVRNRRG